MKMYRVAIIGLGDMGGHHAQAVQAEENCQLIAGCDTQSQKRKTWGNQFGIMATYQYYIEMIEQEQPDIVIISTQAPDHHDPTLAAAERGIHVLCEKPIALNLVQADRMVDTCKSNQIKFSKSNRPTYWKAKRVRYNWRHHNRNLYTCHKSKRFTYF